MRILVKTALALSLGISGPAFAQSMPEGSGLRQGGQSACPAGDPSCQNGRSDGSRVQRGTDQQAPRATESQTRSQGQSERNVQTERRPDATQGQTRTGDAVRKSDRLNNQAESGGASNELRRTQGEQPSTAGRNAERKDPGAPAQQNAEEKGQASKETTASIPDVNVTVEQKTEIRQAITEAKVRPVNVDINISVGVVVPRTVEVHPLPARIIEIVPAYRNYVYFVLADGRIIILEPDTHKVVYVIV